MFIDHICGCHGLVSSQRCSSLQHLALQLFIERSHLLDPLGITTNWSNSPSSFPDFNWQDSSVSEQLLPWERNSFVYIKPFMLYNKDASIHKALENVITLQTTCSFIIGLLCKFHLLSNSPLIFLWLCLSLRLFLLLLWSLSTTVFHHLFSIW